MHLLKWTFPDGPDGRIEIELEQNSQESGYAILSHRWGKAEGEVTFKDMLSGSDLVKTKVGYTKLEGCCRQANQDGHKRVWIDTCCIDKSSSAELSEAITSMYYYYENSQVCYAFLDDIKKRTEPQLDGRNTRRNSLLVSGSAWFERGWTLQELIAPETVKFFDSSWTFLGEKKQLEISKDIEKNSGIHSSILNEPKIIRAVSVSCRMSWAAQRRTERIEDRAYSLMGIFGVHMPPIYGEGHNAFVRLQEEIMRTSNDHTLFAWTLPPPKEIPQRRTFERVSTMLALSPDQFKKSSEFIHRPYSNSFERLIVNSTRLDYTTTNAGLLINLPIAKIDEKQQLYAAFLACTESQTLVRSAILLHTTVDMPYGYFWRANTDAGPIERSGKLWFQAAGRETPGMTTIYILPKLASVTQDQIEPPWVPLECQKSEDVVDMGLPASSPIFQLRRSLVQAEDPCLEELQKLNQARHMIYGQAALSYKEQLKGPRVFPRQSSWQTDGRFFGRSAELQKIKELYKEPCKILDDQTQFPTLLVIISGIGKIGKTELAREFVHLCRDEDLFSWIIWIDASTPTTIEQGFHQVAKDIGLDHTRRENINHVVFSILQWLEGLGKFLAKPGSGFLLGQCLLVLDNVQGLSLTGMDWISQAMPGRVLATSRDNTAGSYLSGLSKTIVLGPLDDDEANHMLQSLTHTNEDLSQVAACWDGTPLTLAQISSMVSVQQSSAKSDADTASRLSDRHNGLALSESLTSQFRQLHPFTFDILAAMSFFDADSTIHCQIFGDLKLHEWRFSGWDFRHDNSVESLMRFSLVTHSGQEDSVRILRLVQNEVQAQALLRPQYYNKVLANAVSWISSAWESKESHNGGQKWISDNLLAHLLQVETLAEKFLGSEGDTVTKAKLVQLMHKREKLVS